MYTMYIYTLFVSCACVVLDAVILWDVEGKFQIKVTQVTNLNVSKETSVRMERERREGERKGGREEGRERERERWGGRVKESKYIVHDTVYFNTTSYNVQ